MADTSFREIHTGIGIAAKGTTPSFTATKFGKGLTLAANTTSWITYSLTPNWVNTNAFSLENIFWATANGWSANATDWMQVVNNTAAASVTQWLFYFAATGATTVAAGVSTAASQTGAFTSAAPQYLHMVSTWDGATLSFYVNGTFVASTAVASLTGTGSAVCFGAAGGDSSAAGTHLLGNIATVAWTAQEVQDRYSDPYGFLSFPGDFASSLNRGSLTQVVTYDAALPGELSTNITSDSASVAGEIFPNVYLRSLSAIPYGLRTNATLTAPSGIVNGDLLLIQFLTSGTTSITATPPAGFSAAPGPSFPVQTTIINSNAYVSSQSGLATGGSSAVSTFALTLSNAIELGANVCIFAGGVPSALAATNWTLTDNVSGNTYTRVGPQYSSFSTFQTAAFYGFNIQNNPTTFTLHATSSNTFTFPALLLDTFTGPYAFDDSAANIQATPGTATNAITSLALNPTVTGDLIWGATVDIGSLGGDTPGTGFTQAQYDGASYLSEYILSHGTGSISATFTNATGGSTANTEWQTIGIALKLGPNTKVDNWTWYKIASSESGNYTVTHAAAQSQGYIAAYGGVDKNTPFAGNEISGTGVGGTTSVSGVTTTRNGSTIVFAGQDIGTTQNVLSGPTGFTADLTTAIGTSWMYVSHYYQNASGATGSQSITNNGGPWAGFLMAIQPPGTGITVTYDAMVAGELQIAFTNDSLVASELLTKLVQDLVSAGELLTTPLRDSQPAGEVKISLVDESQPAGELSFKLVDESQPAGELSIKIIDDSQPAGELIRAIIDESQPAGELMSKVVRDSQPAGELLSSSLTVTANGFVNAELTSSVSRDMGVAGELSTKFTADLVPAAELIRAFVRDLAATAELKAGISTDFRISAEIIASVVCDGKPAGELLSQLLTVTANGLTAGELLIKVVDDSQPAGELQQTLLAISKDGLAGAELLASIVKDTTPAGELISALLTVTMNGLAAGELLHTAVNDARASGELQSSFSGDYATAGELLVRYATDNAPAGELLTKLVLDSKATAELLAGIVDDSQPAGELQRGIVYDALVAGELKTPFTFTVTSDAFGAVELLSTFTVDGYLTAELISGIILLANAFGNDVAIWTCLYSDQAVADTPASDQAVITATESDM